MILVAYLAGIATALTLILAFGIMDGVNAKKRRELKATEDPPC